MYFVNAIEEFPCQYRVYILVVKLPADRIQDFESNR